MSTRRAICLIVMLSGGCQAAGPIHNPTTPRQLRREALAYLKTALTYEHNPAVRVGAIQALEECGEPGVIPWIRTSLSDEHPAARFAGCVALGSLQDESAAAILRDRLADDTPSVRVAALYALHRLGDQSRSGFLPQYMLEDDDPAVRRNATFALGRLDEPGAIKIIARAMRDEDKGVRQHALEAMARLGNAEALQELLFMASSGLGTEEVFAIQALAQTGKPKIADMFRYKLETASHVETKLAAARGLGLLGADDGYDVAIRALKRTEPGIRDPNDPPAGQLLRIHQAAAAALGAIGRVDALPMLADVMRDPSDPRVQVSAAGAILMISRRHRNQGLPFPVATDRATR